MHDILNDIETGIPSSIPCNLNKKMKKRKQLDSLLKFRLSKTNSNDALRSSEDELFLPQQKPSITRLHSSRYRRWWKYFQQIFAFCFVCIFMIVCIGLSYANVELKNEVQNLSSRINEIEKKFSDIESYNLLSTIEQIKTRLNFMERWNFTFIHDQLQLQKLLNNDGLSRSQKLEHKSTQFSEVDKLNRKAEIRAKVMINESVVEWYKQLNSLRNDIRNINQSVQIQELITRFEQLTSLVHNSSDKTSVILTEFQSNFDKLRDTVEECKCSKEPIHSKPSVVDGDRLQQSIVTKPSTTKSPSPIITTVAASRKLINENDQSKKTEDENTIDIEQIVNQP